jgi:hypothetical protein
MCPILHTNYRTIPSTICRCETAQRAQCADGSSRTVWLRVGAVSGSADFTGKLNMSTLRLKGSHFVYEKAVPNKPQNKKHPI